MSHELQFILLNNKGTKQVITFQIYTYNIDQYIYSLNQNTTVLQQNMEHIAHISNINTRTQQNTLSPHVQYSYGDNVSSHIIIYSYSLNRNEN